MGSEVFPIIQLEAVFVTHSDEIHEGKKSLILITENKFLDL